MQTQPTAEHKPVIFSGIQPSGLLTLGNYIGALRNFKLLEDDYDCVYCVVDLHTLTVRQEAAQLRRRCLEIAAVYMAVGLDPDKSLIFCQSHVSAHTELSWILSNYTYVGELQRMTQYKDKCAKHADNINAGLLTYPVLMAADILLYQTHLVPIGADQKQHLEITRDIAQRFNALYGDVFTVPDAYIGKVGSRVMSLQDPTRKMSKSDPEETYIGILDAPEAIRRKLKRAVTDSDGEIRFDPENKPGVSNLLSILSALTGDSTEKLVNDLSGKGYGELKTRAAECIIETLLPIQAEYARIMADKATLQAVLDRNAQRAAARANRTLDKVKHKVGLAPHSKA
jgi:tryptophanyl-tRNA synthetase